MKAKSAKRVMLLAAPLGIGLLLLGAGINSSAPAPSPVVAGAATSQIGVATTSPAPAFAAMAYYDQNCAHCHGPQGTFYGPTLGQKLSDAQLQKEVDVMASGPGNAPLTADQLPVETAFHRALIMRNPFLSVTQMGDDGKWAGEAMPDAKVVLLIGQKHVDAVSDNYGWTAQLPPGTKVSDVKITAELNGVATTLDPTESSYSNTAPLPPSADRPK